MSWLDTLPRLRSLCLQSCELGHLPATFLAASSGRIEKLALRDCVLKARRLNDLPAAARSGASGAQGEEEGLGDGASIESGLSRLSSLASLLHLDLSGSPGALGPGGAGLPAMPRLRTLVAKRCGLRQVPASIRACVDLTDLCLEDNEIRSLPAFIGSMPALQRLGLAGNYLVVNVHADEDEDENAPEADGRQSKGHPNSKLSSSSSSASSSAGSARDTGAQTVD